MKHIFTLVIALTMTACIGASTSSTGPEAQKENPKNPGSPTGGPNPTPIGHPGFTTAQPAGCHPIKHIHFSGDLLTAYEIRYTGFDTDADEWNVVTGKTNRRFYGSNSVALDDAVLSQDENSLIGITAYGALYLWDIKSGKVRRTAKPQNYVYGIGVSPRADLVSFDHGPTYTDHDQLVYDTVKDKILYQETYGSLTMGFSADSSLYYTRGVVDQRSALVAMDLNTKQTVASFPAYNLGDPRLSNSTDGKTIYLAGGYSVIALDARTLKQVGIAKTDWKIEFTSMLRLPDFTPDLKYVQSNRHMIHRGSDGAYIFDGARPGNVWPAHMQFSKDGKMLALAYEDGIVDIRTVGDWKLIHRMCAQK